MSWALIGRELNSSCLAGSQPVWSGLGGSEGWAHRWRECPPSVFSCLQLVKLCSSMIEAGKAYVTTNRLFVSGIRDLSQHCQGDTVISVRSS